MWNKLVKNINSELLHGCSGGNSLEVDSRNHQVMAPENLRYPSKQLLPKSSSSSEAKQSFNYKLFVSTWNVGGKTPSDDLSLEDWLDSKNKSYDIYVLGFQEIVPLVAKNVLVPEKNRASLMKWNSLVSAALNKEIDHEEEEEEEGKVYNEKQKVYPKKNGSRRGYKCIVSKQMVGIMISIWVRSELRQYIRHLSVSCIGCGFLGYLGNKGSVSARFCLHNTSLCFVCCHLASGGKDGDEIHRKSNAKEIFSRTTFPRRSSSPDLPQTILNHDGVILLGDLNYRISLPEAKTKSLVQQKQWPALLNNDQEIIEGGAFEGWQEGHITFSPTYKYYPNSDKYYGCCQNKEEEKRRAPAWCDRILWFGNGLRELLYDKGDLKLSDHRFVRAIFTVEVEE